MKFKNEPFEIAKSTKRIEWLDMARGICMLFVMISHLEICPIIYKIVFGPVFLSMFFFISGYGRRHEHLYGCDYTGTGKSDTDTADFKYTDD
mgnify:CR=1 FL=1